MPFSAKLGTPLSNFEAGENYKDVDDPSLTVALALKDQPNTYLLIWTTTPWTLISNLAVMMGPDLDYVKVLDKKSGKHYILANSCLSTNYKNDEDFQILETFKGKALEGMRYEPLFNYYADRAAKGAFRVIMEESISTDEGTGLVHSAPAFGEVDFFACQREKIDLVIPVDNNGLFTKEIPEYQGLFVKDADKEIMKRLKLEGKVVHQGTCHHRYPFCWRSDTPLIYKAVRTWFVAVEKFKDKMVQVNQQVHWTPNHIKDGRFGKWLENARDWAISRNRYWGTPIPLWRADDGEILAIGSIAELEGLADVKVKDLHRHFIDQIEITKGGKLFRRIPEVFDCWFDAGSMPYAQNHYPFENRELFEKNFPADFIAEGLDQTRGWFYTLTILSTAIFGQPPFKNVIVNGIILAEDGSKMSKRLRNYPDPGLVIQKFGADAVRLYMLNSPAVRADDLCFSESGVELVLRQVLIPFWNSYSFFITYARIYNWKPKQDKLAPEAQIDQWILSLLNSLIHQVESAMDDYDLSRAVGPFVGFVEQLTNWYIRRSRRRFWSDQPSPDRDQAFATLYHVLVNLSKVAAPFIPFLSEAIYRNLRDSAMPESVHLCDYPVYDTKRHNEPLEASMAAVQTLVSLGHSLRKEHALKVRQPLAQAHVVSEDHQVLGFLKDQQHLIADELNVKQVVFSTNEGEFVSLKAKPNFRVLGKKVGKLMKAAQSAIDLFDQRQLTKLMNGEQVKLQLDGEEFTLNSEDVQVERLVREGLVAANQGHMTIVLDTKLTDALLREGMAREIVNKINTMRREADFNVTDRIKLRMKTTEKVKESFNEYKDFISNEVLAVDVSFGECQGTEWDLNGELTVIALEVVK
jgi:isoleucyl-tRNA synthetase